ncbi:MAG: RES family NAD+ phosphorylase [Haloechinothrix sp.]
MARLPLPPSAADLAAELRIDEDVVAIHPATRLVRIFTARGRHHQQWNTFRYTGPLPHGRFDPQLPQPDGSPATDPNHGVLYFSLSVRTSVAEVFQTTSTVDRSTRSPHLLVIRPARTLRLLDLTGLWPTRLGASQQISSGPKRITQVWARTIREAHPSLDGLWYRSSMDSGDPAICLWDPPARSAIPDYPDVLLPLDHPGLDLPLARVCNELNYLLLG